MTTIIRMDVHKFVNPATGRKFYFPSLIVAQDGQRSRRNLRGFRRKGDAIGYADRLIERYNRIYGSKGAGNGN